MSDSIYEGTLRMNRARTRPAGCLWWVLIPAVTAIGLARLALETHRFLRDAEVDGWD